LRFPTGAFFLMAANDLFNAEAFFLAAGHSYLSSQSIEHPQSLTCALLIIAKARLLIFLHG
jgi:hypothetical protein